MVGAASLWPWLWRRSVLATVLSFSCCTRRGNKGFFFFWFCCLFSVCERSLCVAVVLHHLWRKGGHGLWEILGEFSSQKFFLQLNERRVFGNQRKDGEMGFRRRFFPTRSYFLWDFSRHHSAAYRRLPQVWMRGKSTKFLFSAFLFVCSSLPSFLPLL
jgi:hypothetical protein